MSGPAQLSCKGCGSAPVDVGVQSSYKEFSGGEFFAGPPAVSGNPMPEDAYYQGKLKSGWGEFQPVFELVKKQQWAHCTQRSPHEGSRRRARWAASGCEYTPQGTRRSSSAGRAPVL